MYFRTIQGYCKKINGKLYYFGSNTKEALQKYLDQATNLHGCQEDVQQQDTYRMYQNKRTELLKIAGSM